MNGYFNILKPTGMSSAAVVAVMRRLTGMKRVGHAGTLDPEAAGRSLSQTCKQGKKLL